MAQSLRRNKETEPTCPQQQDQQQGRWNEQSHKFRERSAVQKAVELSAVQKSREATKQEQVQLPGDVSLDDTDYHSRNVARQAADG